MAIKRHVTTMPTKHDLDPDAMTEAERLAKRRFEAYFAFETNPESFNTETFPKQAEETE